MRSLALIVSLAALCGPALAQAPAAPVRPVEPPSNTPTGIAIDRFIGDANRAPSKITYDVMLTQSILTQGDPQAPGNPGAVLLLRKEVALNTLQPGETTSLVRVPEQMVFYVESGEGRLDDGRSFWPLKPGVALLAPSNVAHRFSATGAAPLKMLSVSMPLEAGVTPKTEMIVRDVTKMAMTERNVHWSNMAKYVFVGDRDGLYPTDRVFLVYMGPMTIAGPHAHTPGQEEIWIKATEGKSIMQLGSEIRPWPINAGFLAPPNGQTVHAAYNLDDHIQAWFYVSRLSTAPTTPAPPNPNRPAPPPAIAEALQRSTIAGTPLQPEPPPRRGR